MGVIRSQRIRNKDVFPEVIMTNISIFLQVSMKLLFVSTKQYKLLGIERMLARDKYMYMHFRGVSNCEYQNVSSV